MPSRRPRAPFGAVLFDLDGTLVDTAPDIADAVNLVLEQRGLPRVPPAWVRDRIGFGSRALLERTYQAAAGAALAATRAGRTRVAAKAAPTEELIEEFAEQYAQRCGRRGRLFPGAAAMLATLRNTGVKLALLTNKETRFAEFVLRVHGLDTAFDVRVCGDTLPVKKPDGAVVRHCLKLLRVAPRRALLVGDSAIDVRTARNGGVAVWAVNYGYNQERPIDDAKPDRVIAALAELLPPVAPALEALAAGYSPRASSSSRYFRSNPRN